MFAGPGRCFQCLRIKRISEPVKLQLGTLSSGTLILGSEKGAPGKHAAVFLISFGKRL